MGKIMSCVAALLLAATATAQVAVEQWGVGDLHTYKGYLSVQPAAGGDKDAGPWVITVDLKALPDFGEFSRAAGAEILHASLWAFRPMLDGTDDAANVDVEVFPLLGRPAAGGQPKLAAKPLALEAPWYGSFDATQTVRGWAEAPDTNFGLYVKSFPKWEPERTYLELAYKGRSAAAAPKQVEGLQVLHRAGQTFITFNEIDKRIEKDPVTYGQLKDLTEAMDKTARVRYRVYRHTQPITAEALGQAEFLAEVAPFSAYNVNGRSVDELIAQVRRRAIDNLDLAKTLAGTGYFGRYNPQMPEMAGVVINRLAVEDGKPLPLATGLYVHSPAKEAKAYYAVIASVNGTANTRDFSAANSLQAAVDEKPGAGEPVLQKAAQVTVFFDYPGTRQQYVQWCAPPLANLPNQYYNWGVFVPRDYDKATTRRLSIHFHDVQQRYLKPAWPHRRDTVLISPHDYPYRSFGYGYDEALGTLRSFGQGKVWPFFALRADAVRDWATAKFKADPACVSCGGSGYWGGTAAVQYGLKRPGKIAYVLADAPDADPQQTPESTAKERTNRPLLEAVWGKLAWACKTDGGKSIWEEVNLPAYIRAAKVPLPFITLGAGGQHQTWKQETDLMKAYMESRNGFMAEFFWGATPFVPLPVTADSGDLPFEPRTDRPLLACWPKATGITPKFYEDQFLTGKRGYSSGDRFNTRPRWLADDVVDTPDRLELTIFSGQVVYAGSETTETTLRNAQKFKPAAGEKLSWSVAAKGGAKAQSGELTVGAGGLVMIPALTFGGQSRLVIQRAGATTTPAPAK